MKCCIKKNLGGLIVVALILGVVSCANGPNGSTGENGSTDSSDSSTTHEHTYATEWTTNSTDHWYAATCDHKDLVKDKAAHTFGEYVSNNDATTESDGTKTRKCTVCGYEETIADEGSKLHIHTWNAGAITKESTITEFGEKTFICTDCEETKIQYLPTLADENGFVKVMTVEIEGNETWIPESRVFVKGRKLTIPTLFVCDHEVTKGEYKTVMGNDPGSEYIYDKDDNTLTGDDALNGAVSSVNWYDALVYCNERSKTENLTPCYSINGSTDTSTWGDAPASKNETWDAAVCNFEANGYRLPTEAEWEFLIRGGENFTYAGSNDIDEVAWVSKNNHYKGIREVKLKKPNGYGLYDMSGNVWEWCWDWYCSDPKTSTPASGETSGTSRLRRGGGRDSGNIVNTTVFYHDGDNPSNRSDTYGLRVVRTAK